MLLVERGLAASSADGVRLGVSLTERLSTLVHAKVNVSIMPCEFYQYPEAVLVAATVRYQFCCSLHEIGGLSMNGLGLH